MRTEPIGLPLLVLAPPDELPELAGRLRAAGIARVAFVTHAAERDLTKLRPGVRTDTPLEGPGGVWDVFVLALA